MVAPNWDGGLSCPSEDSTGLLLASSKLARYELALSNSFFHAVASAQFKFKPLKAFSSISDFFSAQFFYRFIKALLRTVMERKQPLLRLKKFLPVLVFPVN